MGDLLDRIGTQSARKRVYDQPRQGNQRQNEDAEANARLEVTTLSQKYRLRSMPLYRWATCSAYPLNGRVGRRRSSPSRRSRA